MKQMFSRSTPRTLYSSYAVLWGLPSKLFNKHLWSIHVRLQEDTAVLCRPHFKTRASLVFLFSALNPLNACGLVHFLLLSYQSCQSFHSLILLLFELVLPNTWRQMEKLVFPACHTSYPHLCISGSLAVLRHLIWLELKNPYTLDLTVFLTKTGFPTKFAKVAQETEEARHSKPVSYALHWITKIARKNWICMG